MTSKKRRQRGTRTHGKGSHKNNRGAGNRGGRGKAGRSKHEQHNYEELGKSGFKPPEDDIEKEVINIGELNELIYEAVVEFDSSDDSNRDSGLTGGSGSGSFGGAAADGGAVVRAQQGVKLTPNGRPDRVDLTELYPDADVVKYLGTGELRYSIRVKAHDCSTKARKKTKAEGGSVHLEESSSVERTELEKLTEKRYKKDRRKNHDMNFESYLEQVETGKPLEPTEFDDVIRHADDDVGTAYDIMEKQAALIDDLDGVRAFNLMRSREFAAENGLDTDPFDRVLGPYFEDVDLPSGYKESLVEDLPENQEVFDILDGLQHIRDSYEADVYEENPELKEQRVQKDEKEYLAAVDTASSWG